jgi:hypothetical protein
MIKINENFTVDADEHNWILNDFTPGPSGKRPRRPRQSYYPRLELALQKIITLTGKDCPDLKMAIRRIVQVRGQIVEAVRDAGLQKAA